MKPPIFDNFFRFSQKKKIAETPESFKKTVKKSGGFKKLSFSRFATNNPILKCKILHLKMGFSFGNFKKYSFFETPSENEITLYKTILMTKKRDVFVKKCVLF